MKTSHSDINRLNESALRNWLITCRWFVVRFVYFPILFCTLAGNSWAQNHLNDISIDSVTLRWPDPAVPGEVQLNSRVKADIVTTHQFKTNIDVVDVWVTALKLAGGDSEVMVKHSQTLDQGGSTRFSLTIPVPLGANTMVIKLDPENRLSELNEDNNQFHFIATGKPNPPIEWSAEDRQKLLEARAKMWPPERLEMQRKKYTIGVPVETDLEVYADAYKQAPDMPGFFHHRITINNLGPERLPASLLSRLSVEAHFADRNIICRADLSGPRFTDHLTDLVANAQFQIDMFLESYDTENIKDKNTVCLPALLPERDYPEDPDPDDDKWPIYFLGGKMPDSFIKVDTELAEKIFPGRFDYYLIDQKEANNQKHYKPAP